MPKRSNDFQKLIYQIYNQLVPNGAIVTESAMIQRKNSKRKREIDILIEYGIAGHKSNMAIECRDRSRKDDETWIDDLIGKYIDLPINKIIAVSRLGFSEGAKEKAAQHGIETLSLRHATEIDWQYKFTKLGMATPKWTQHFYALTLELEPPFSGELVLDNYSLLNSEGHNIGKLSDFAKEVFHKNVVPDLNSYIKANFLSLFKVLADITNKSAFIDYKFLISDSRFISVNNAIHQLNRMNFKVHCVFSYDRQEAAHYVYNDQALVSSWDIAEGQKVNIIQKSDDKKEKN